MKKMKLMALALMAFASVATGFAQMAYNCEGCKPLADREVVYMSSLSDGLGNQLKEVEVLTCDKLYILDGKYYVDSAKTLVINSGVVVKATYEGELNSSALIVTRDAKIYADGSECCPIIFTSVDDDLDGDYPIYTKERWGGIIILGRAQNTVAKNEKNPEAPAFTIGESTGGIAFIEGVDAGDSRHYYGSEIELGVPFKNDDNSGRLNFVSIRHGGSELGDANEINGLTLGSVGSGTILTNIEVVSNGDDGIEFFGGTVNLKYARILYCEDDYIDWDQGYEGKIQFVTGVQRPASATGGFLLGNHGMECDGDDGTDFDRAWLSNPTVSNVTMLGVKRGAASEKKNYALELKERTQGKIYNSIFSCFDRGINLKTGADTVLIKNCTFVAMDVDVSGTPVTGYDPQNGTMNNLFPASLPGISSCDWVSSWDAVPNSGGTAYDVNADDSWFTPVNYRGAYDPTQKVWWSMDNCNSDDYRADDESTSATSCPTDLNYDGITDASDLGVLIGQYGLNCVQ